jgi:phage recombination protein Bet
MQVSKTATELEMNAIVTEPRKSITADMAARHSMEAVNFERTLRATVFPGNGTPEQFAAFLMVARQYDLNPVTREIFAFPSKGGIVPVVSIDGWIKLINSHPQMDGVEFEDRMDTEGALTAVTCRIWRKDRSKAIAVTEYLSECYRATDAWKMKHRMLRHKSLIQCARVAFGFAGIYDPDEGERIVIAQDGRDNHGTAVITSGKPSLTAKLDQLAGPAGTIEYDPQTGEIKESGAVPTDPAPDEAGAQGSHSADAGADPSPAPASYAARRLAANQDVVSDKERVRLGGLAAAKEGPESLGEFLRFLEPDDAALVNPAMRKEWNKATIDGKGVVK